MGRGGEESEREKRKGQKKGENEKKREGRGKERGGEGKGQMKEGRKYHAFYPNHSQGSIERNCIKERVLNFYPS